MTDFKKLKVVELRAELASRNLSQTGKRNELIERLEEYEFHNAEPQHEDQAMEVDVIDEGEALSGSFTIPQSIAVVNEALETDQLAAIEEDKRRQRALRFGLDTNEIANVNIEITIKKLEHALPTKSHHRKHHHRYHHSHKQEYKINKA